jgi:hypothetical protein
MHLLRSKHILSNTDNHGHIFSLRHQAQTASLGPTLHPVQMALGALSTQSKETWYKLHFVQRLGMREELPPHPI